jgi:hypothetical protein
VLRGAEGQRFSWAILLQRRSISCLSWSLIHKSVYIYIYIYKRAWHEVDNLKAFWSRALLILPNEDMINWSDEGLLSKYDARGTPLFHSSIIYFDLYIYIYIYIYAQHCAPCFYPNFVGVSSTLLESYMTHPRWGAPKFERSWSRNSSNRLIIYSAIRLQCKKQKLLLPSHTSHALSQVYIHFTNISPWRG